MRPTVSESVDKLCKTWEDLYSYITDEIGCSTPTVIENKVAESLDNFSKNLKIFLANGKEYVDLKKDICKTTYMLIALMSVHGISMDEISVEMSEFADGLIIAMEEAYGSTRKE